MNIHACLLTFTFGWVASVIGILVIFNGGMIGLIPFFIGIIGIILNIDTFNEEWREIFYPQQSKVSVKN